MGVHITGVYLMGVYFTGMHLMGMHLTGVHLTGMCLMGVYLITLFREWCSDEGLQGCELALLRAERCCHRHYGLALTPYRKRQERNEPSVVITET